MEHHGRHSARMIPLLIGGFLISGCAHQLAIQNGPASISDTIPTSSAPKSSPQLVFGKASYYSPKLQGKKTACGEKYDARQFTAAHPTLPFHTLVKVRHVASGKAVVVRVNDRGPFHGNRIIDLSRAAAVALGIIHDGVADVALEVVSPPQPPMNVSPMRYTAKPGSATSPFGVTRTDEDVTEDRL